MALIDDVRAFVTLCEQGKTMEAIERYYADDVVVFENYGRARTGREECLVYERDALAQVPEQSTLKSRGQAVDPATGRAFVEWVIRFMGGDGRPMRLEEVAVQRWAAGRIVEERFYYEGVIDEGDELEPPEHEQP